MKRRKKKTVPFHIKILPDEKKAIEHAAEVSGFDVTTWARLLFRKTLGLDEEDRHGHQAR